MTSRQLTTALLFLGPMALGATQYLGSPWPGVVLCGLSIVPWGLGEWLGRGSAADSEERVSERRRVDALVTLANDTRKVAVDAHLRIEEQGQQINSLRSAISLRGTLGG